MLRPPLHLASELENAKGKYLEEKEKVKTQAFHKARERGEFATLHTYELMTS